MTTATVAQSQTPAVRQRVGWWPISLLTLPLLSLVVYWPVLRQPFVLDDYIWLAAARNHTAAAFFRRALTFPVATAFDVPTPFWRPLIDAYFFGAWRLWGAQPLPYHLVNVALHGTNAVLLAALVRMLTRNRIAALLAGALFVTLPAYDFAVAWISDVTDLLGAMCYLATILLFLRHRRAARGYGLYAAALLLMAVSLTAKESAATLPAVLGIVAVASAPPRSWRAVGRLVGELLPFAALTVGYAAFLYTREYRTLSGFGIYQIDWRFLAHEWQYLRRLTLPVEVERGAWLTGASHITAALFLLAGVAALAMRRWVAGALFLWTLLALLPFSFFRAGIEYRYTYLAALPFAGFVALLAVGGARTLLRSRERRWAVPVAGAVAASVLGALAIETRHRQAWLADQATAYGDLVRATPVLCGALPPGSRIVIVDSPAFDLYGDSLAMLMNVLYHQAVVVRPERGQDSLTAGDCVLRWAGSGYVRE